MKVEITETVEKRFGNLIKNIAKQKSNEEIEELRSLCRIHKINQEKLKAIGKAHGATHEECIEALTRKFLHEMNLN